jgi:hypothetical protein
MEVIEKAIHDGAHVVTVEFVADGGDVVSVGMTRHEDDGVTKLTAEESAKGMLADVIASDIAAVLASSPPVSSDRTKLTEEGENPASVSLRLEREARETGTLDDELDEGLASTFPASDPVSVSSTTIPGSGPSTSGK